MLSFLVYLWKKWVCAPCGIRFPVIIIPVANGISAIEWPLPKAPNMKQELPNKLFAATPVGHSGIDVARAEALFRKNQMQLRPETRECTREAVQIRCRRVKVNRWMSWRYGRFIVHGFFLVGFPPPALPLGRRLFLRCEISDGRGGGSSPLTKILCNARSAESVQISVSRPGPPMR